MSISRIPKSKTVKWNIYCFRTFSVMQEKNPTLNPKLLKGEQLNPTPVVFERSLMPNDAINFPLLP